MAPDRKERGSGSGWSFFLSIIFFLLVGGMFHYFYEEEIGLQRLTDISFFEFFILSLAVFRVQRLMVYDSVAQYIRDFFLIKEEEYDKETGTTFIIRYKHKGGPMRLFADLLSCPWCVGVWASAAAVMIYFILPWTWPFWLLMAIAGASSCIMLTVNLIGWKAEGSKIVVKSSGGERQ